MGVSLLQVPLSVHQGGGVSPPGSGRHHEHGKLCGHVIVDAVDLVHKIDHPLLDSQVWEHTVAES